MKYSVLLFFIVCSIKLYAQSPIVLDSTKTFFPAWKEIRSEKIDWYYLIVPENYNNLNGKKIKLAVTVLRSLTAINTPVVFVQGGPGGSTISGLWRWLEHPLRQTGDIVLIDLRGTGLSEPSMCPDLGKKFFEILAKNQDAKKDAQDKVRVSLECQQDLIDRGIDLGAYNSISISKDLNELKKQLKFNSWNVYGQSYGTFLCQEYARDFPNDIRSLILDSSIPDISEYYNRNTSNYLGSLNRLFQQCRNNSQCNEAFPELESVYYNIINDLIKNPITVKVDKSILPSGSFTYNADDFKIAIHQAFYQKPLIEVLPLLIYQFHNRNEAALSALVSAFSGALSLDYGAYYCATCSEAIPRNDINEFIKDAALNKKLQDGLSFYKSDFDVCSAWNKRAAINTSILNYKKDNKYPVIIFSGGFDPITPNVFAQETSSNYNNSNVVFAATYGHGPSSSEMGNNILSHFVNYGYSENDSLRFKKTIANFVTKITLNKGTSNFGVSINNFDWIFLFPFL